MNDCTFCRIIRGDEPRHHVWEDDQFIVFLTRRPMHPGHLVIVPRHHVDYFFDMDEATYAAIFQVARQLEPVLHNLTKAKRIGLAVEGFGIAHAHLHLIPMDRKGGLDSTLAYDATEEELTNMSTQLRQALAVAT